MKIQRALISVSDKTEIVDFARELSTRGVEIIATNGTLKVLKQSGIRFVKNVSDVTNFPEILDGRIKTIHPKLIGGLLALRDKKSHMDELEELEVETVDMVVCNLYPVEKEVAHDGNLRAVLDEIDIGGVNLIRASAKNFENVVVITNCSQYTQILKELQEKGDVSIQTRHILAIEAFKKTARYDQAIYEFLQKAMDFVQ